MRLHSHHVDVDELGTTIAAQIEFDELDEEPFAPRFHFPPGWQIDRTMSPFVPLAAALACHYGESLVVEEPVYESVLTSARAAMPVMSMFRMLPRVSIEAPTRSRPPVPKAGRRAAQFLSRGVDSTACLVLSARGELPVTTDLGIIVSGIEPFLDADHATAAIDASIRMAAAFDLDTLVVGANAWDQTFGRVLYIQIHGSVFAGIAIALRHHLRSVACASTGRVADPEGSHPALDPLWSDTDLTFHHLISGMPRADRVRAIAEDGRGLAELRVCWLHADRNCGRCRKCLLTAALLDVHGALEATTTFDRGRVDPEELRQEPPAPYFIAELIEAFDPTRPDLADALRRVHDRFNDPWAWLPELPRLRGILGTEPGAARPIAWCTLGSLSGEGVEVLDAVRSVLGAGLSWSTDTLPVPVIDRVLSESRFALWLGPEDEIDTRRVLAALENGARPVQVVSEPAATELRAELPQPLDRIVVALHEIANLRDEPPGVVAELSRAIATGGTGWLRPPATIGACA